MGKGQQLVHLPKKGHSGSAAEMRNRYTHSVAKQDE